ncbi:MAG: DUF3021 domain-containing protein [Clostridia bacterium]|nr:DUF3021 domain-containing protein [Clostridia bacterium]
MKKTVLEFFRRGIMACGIGPAVLAVIYQVLHSVGKLDTLSAEEVSVGIFSLLALAFIAGGINAVYQIERLPLMLAILIHGMVLYVAYLVTYLLNDWLEWGAIPVIVFSAAFVVGYLAIWAVVYSVIKRNTKRVNELLTEKQNKQ